VDAQAVEGALDALTPDERNAVRLIVCEGKSYQHAAESLGVTVTTVNNWKHRGLVKMRRHIAETERDAARRPALPLRREPYARSSVG
jgi:DNA-directed RNA polymerase specialized sigma24 family protein